MSDWSSSWKCYTVIHDKIKCNICGLEACDETELAKAHANLEKIIIEGLREIENENRIDGDSQSNLSGQYFTNEEIDFPIRKICNQVIYSV